MSLRFFTVLAHSSGKREDLGLRPVRIHSIHTPRSFAFHGAAQEAAPHYVDRQATMRKTAERGLPTPRWSTPSRRGDRTTTLAYRLRIKRALVQTPPDGSFRKAPSLPDSPMSHSTTRSVLIPRPAATARLCFFGFQKIFSAKLRKERGQKDFPNLPKMHRLALGAGHIHHPSTQSARVWGPRYSRRFAQECPE